MDDLKLLVPTYNASLYPDEVAEGKLPEFGDPFVPVVIWDAEGVKIVLGSHRHNDGDKPDVQIERHPKGWMIFLHPCAGSGPSGHVYFLDDGRSYVRPERPCASTEPILMLEDNETLPEIHGKRY